MKLDTVRYKILLELILVFLGGLFLILFSYIMGGFPFKSEPSSQIIWIELVFLLILLGIPLFR